MAAEYKKELRLLKATARRIEKEFNRYRAQQLRECEKIQARADREKRAIGTQINKLRKGAEKSRDRIVRRIQVLTGRLS